MLVSFLPGDALERLAKEPASLAFRPRLQRRFDHIPWTVAATGGEVGGAAAVLMGESSSSGTAPQAANAVSMLTSQPSRLKLCCGRSV